MATRVLIADDEPGIRLLVKRMLLRRDCWDVVGEASDGDEIIEAVERLDPDVVVLDLVMRTRGDEILPHLVRRAPTCMVAVFSSLDGREHRDRLLQLGAFSYYQKQQLSELPDLLAADYEQFQRALAGEDVVVPWQTA